MEAMITVIVSGSEQDATVYFKTPYGESWGHWVGVPPELHETYAIEFAIGEAFI